MDFTGKVKLGLKGLSSTWPRHHLLYVPPESPQRPVWLRTVLIVWTGGRPGDEPAKEMADYTIWDKDKSNQRELVIESKRQQRGLLQTYFSQGSVKLRVKTIFGKHPQNAVY